TVFPAGTDVKVRRDKNRMSAPGISDNGTGLISLVALARALHEAHIKPQRTILFVADVGEEGEGNLRGMRILVDTYRDRLKADIRSENEDELLRLETALRECMAAGVRDEMESARDRSKGKLEWKVDILGNRPGGELAADSPLLAALRAADDYTANTSRPER